MALGQHIFSALDLRHVAAMTARIAALPGVPTTDWCIRAASALAIPRSGIRVRVGLLRAHDDGQLVLDDSIQVGAAGAEDAGPLDDAEAQELSVRLSRRFARVADADADAHITSKDESDERILYVYLRIPQREQDSWLAVVYRCALDTDLEVIVSLVNSIVPYLKARIHYAFQSGAGGEQSGVATPAEHRVLERIVLGLTIKKIAEDLNRSPHTVHDHVKSLHRKFHAKSRGELIARVLGNGRLPVEVTLKDAAVHDSGVERERRLA